MKHPDAATDMTMMKRKNSKATILLVPQPLDMAMT
jgi:hypothetical protein